MKKIGLLIIIMLFLSLSVGKVFATTFRPTDLDKELSQTDSIIHAKYKGSVFKSLKGGVKSIVTVASFEVISYSGIIQSDLPNPKNFQILLPGGRLAGVVRKVEGVPSFKKGEEVVLFLVKKDFGYRLTNLSASKFEVKKNAQGKKILVNAAFPNHPGLSNIELDSLDLKLSMKEMGSLKIQNEKVVQKKIDNTNSDRAPASARQKNKKKDSDESLPVYAYFLFLFILGGIYRYVAKKHS